MISEVADTVCDAGPDANDPVIVHEAVVLDIVVDDSVVEVTVVEVTVVDDAVSVSIVSLVVVEDDVPVNSPKVSSNRLSVSSVVDEEVPISVGGIILPLSSTGRSSAVFSPSKLISFPPSGISLSSVGTGPSSGSCVNTIVTSVEETTKIFFNTAKSPRTMEDELIANS